MRRRHDLFRRATRPRGPRSSTDMGADRPPQCGEQSRDKPGGLPACPSKPAGFYDYVPKEKCRGLHPEAEQRRYFPPAPTRVDALYSRRSSASAERDLRSDAVNGAGGGPASR
jgi:hypothetical protein